MENSEDEMEEDEAEWTNSFVDSSALSSAAASASSSSSTSGRGTSNKPGPGHDHRVILHFDLDCFYAQVEMIRNPALREVPLGIQQKYIIVTCNYVARDLGVTKLMSVTDAKEKCPSLVLVRGEDLTHYREMSYKVTELLTSYCPLVERLGFDENFVDVTDLVERRLAEMATESDGFSFKGHVYGRSSADVKAADYPALVLGSHIAAELREALSGKLGLTGCAGVASNKLLAKLVSGTFKPNQQTVLLPENVSDIMDSLSGLRKVPGVGHQTAKRLQALGLVSVKDLQLCPLDDLATEFGGATAQRLKNLVLGVDDSPVTPSGPPQSLSDEDSFKKMSSPQEVLEKVQQLLTSLVERMHKDGRQPQTFRLTIRRYSATNKWFGRESRQCPIPNHVGQKISSGGSEDAVVLLVPLAMKLFNKMVDGGAAFHLTLINVCFSNLQSRGAGAITSFFTPATSPGKTQAQVQDGSSDSGVIAQRRLARKGPFGCEASLHGFTRKQSSVVAAAAAARKASCSEAGRDPDDSTTTSAVTHRLPANVDPEVFELLPEEIQKELLASDFALSSPSVSDSAHMSGNKPPQTFTDSENIKAAANGFDSTSRGTGGDVTDEERPSLPRSSDCEFPGNVDPGVFSELPPDVQRELLSEWKQQKPALKTPSSRKPAARSSTSRDRKTAGRSSQANNLFKYFKPS
ncbi:DNA polymerase iota [Mugil cephalus]|uniref:DNA polymerase iota n=1 Tax=Mugil cephalus TaxID=48193 RepID=UPI001FB65EB8|nr:DNA polymerase iota [Mugil cephalus]